MAPKYVSDCMILLLKLTVFLMFVFSTSSTKQCTTKKTEVGCYVIRNVGIKQCQVKCAESGECLSYEYNIETLTCRLSRAESKDIEKEKGYVILARDHSQVPTGSCTSSICSFGQRCLKSRSGKEVCVQDEKHSGLERSVQQNVDKEESFPSSPLHDACRKGDLRLVKRLLGNGFDINSGDKHGKTPLIVAAQKGYCKIFTFLIRKGANLSKDDNDSKNALHWACKGGHESMWECVLKQYGQSVHNEKISVLSYAAYGGKKDLCEFLVCIGANASGHIEGKSVLTFAIRGGHMNVVKYLLSQDSTDINSRGEAGRTHLMRSAMYGRREVFDFLVRMGANVSLVDDGGDNILHIASIADESEIVQYIISKHILDINSRGRNGMTPLMTAAFTGHIAVLDLLVRNGGQIDLVDDNGRNILHLASSGGHVNTVKHILSQRMADINAWDNDGETAAMIAKRERKSDVFQFLVSKGCPVK